jgi:hypothetical protein
MSVAVPLAAVLTAAATVTIFETPWTALPGVFGGMVTTSTGPLVALGHIVTKPTVAQVAVIDTSEAVLDTVTVIELPESTSEESLAAGEQNQPIDYMRLNSDVRVVTDTLDRFNQKLLRMIAQAKAAQSSRPVRSPAVDTDSTVAIDLPSNSPETAAELKQ